MLHFFGYKPSLSLDAHRSRLRAWREARRGFTASLDTLERLWSFLCQMAPPYCISEGEVAWPRRLLQGGMSKQRQSSADDSLPPKSGESPKVGITL